MDEANLTPWFPPEVKPVRRGVYWTALDATSQLMGYCRWDGRQWANQREVYNNDHADARRHAASLPRDDRGMQNKPWRGLKEPSNG